MRSELVDYEYCNDVLNIVQDENINESVQQKIREMYGEPQGNRI